MAPSDVKSSPNSSTSYSKVPQSFEDDDRWTDVIEQEEKDSSLQTEPPPPAATTPVGPIQYPMAPIPTPYDPFVRPQPTAQMALENRLVYLAEVELGTLNAVDVLERNIINGEPINNIREIKIFPNMPLINHTRYQYGNDRSDAIQRVRDIGYLIGLKRAVKFLEDAVDDPERQNVKYTLTLLTPQPIPPPPPQQLPVALPPAPLAPVNHSFRDDLRAIAKEVVKDTVNEYKNEVVIPATEAVQQEMIKLCRDVCRDALARKD